MSRALLQIAIPKKKPQNHKSGTKVSNLTSCSRCWKEFRNTDVLKLRDFSRKLESLHSALPKQAIYNRKLRVPQKKF